MLKNFIPHKRFIFLAYTLVIFIISTQAQSPVADFSQNQTSGCGYLIVKFTDLSSGSPDAWIWDFGDGTANSTIQHPTHAYLTTGTFNVKLTASNSQGSNTIVKNALIKVYPNPGVQFTSSVNTGCIPFSVQFNDISTVDTPIQSWYWNFGDGQQSVDSNPNHTYVTTGNYSVSLTLVDTNGCTGTLSQPNMILAETAPDPSFSVLQSEGCTAPFNAQFSNNTTGSDISYLWYFGDGDTSSLFEPHHTYSSNGIFDVTLICTTTAGCKDTLIYNDYIQVGTFIASFGSNITQGCYPLNVSFFDSSNANAVLWYFGDGDSSALANPSHVYQNTGSYTVTLIAQSLSGCYDTVIVPNLIHVGQGLPVDFSYSDSSSCIIPFDVYFSCIVSGAAQYLWNFGDGFQSSLPNPLHSYQSNGTYSVSLSVTDSAGCTSVVSKSDIIHVFSPIAYFTGHQLNGCDSVHAVFEDSTLSSSMLVNWWWDFGDGTPILNQGPMVQHWFTDTGAFSVKLVIENAEGCRDSVIRPHFVRVGLKPQISFFADDTIGCHRFQVFYTGNINPVTSNILWRFGDGQMGFGDTISHIYADTGFFTVKLIAIHFGCIDSLTNTNYIYVQAPKPLFTADSNYFCTVPHWVTFSNQSHGGNQWLWDFGDGTTDTSYTPTHLYTVNGLYDIILWATDTVTGCKDSLVMSQFVGISEINTGFLIDTNVICQRTPVLFTDTSIHHFQIVDRVWDYGNGTTQHISTVPHQYAFDTSGVFDIKLLLEDAVGCKDSITISQMITVNPVPTSGFFANIEKGCAPLEITFEQYPNPETIIASSWTYSDGNTDTLANPIHVFQHPGIYNVNLILTNQFGCDSTFVRNNYIEVTHPQTYFTINNFANTQQAAICHYNTATFNNQTTGSGLNFIWSFGDGNFSTDISPTHQYSVTQTTDFNVHLNVIDTNGCDSSFTRTITISHPLANFDATVKVSDCPPFLASFLDNSSVDVVQWNWNFGDYQSGSSNTSVINEPVHEFSVAGLYDISLIVNNSIGCYDTIVKEDFITVNGPSGNFNYAPLAGCSPKDVIFTANAQNTATYFWLLGDGNTIQGSLDSVVYTYNQGGNYIPVLLLEDSLSSPSDTATCIITLIGNQPIRIINATLQFSVSNTFSCDGDTLFFIDNSISNGTISSWHWEFGDGNSSDLQNPSYYIDVPGNYTITLTVQVDSCYFTDSIPAFISIFNPPTFGWNISDSSECLPLTATFQPNQNSIFNQLSYWTWNFGNGNWADSIQNPQTAYYSSGLYPVSFMAEFDNGCSHLYTQYHNITVYPLPIADFTYTETSTYFIENEVLLNDISQGDIVEWYWDFGDGGLASEQNPIHNFAYADSYDVTLIVETDNSCIDTVKKTIQIKEKLTIPNAFTPNNDGKNDLFLRGVPMTILNRWGEVLYEGSEGWDGKFKGSRVPDGTYFYIITLKNIKGEEKKQNGTVTIIEKKK